MSLLGTQIFNFLGGFGQQISLFDYEIVRCDLFSLFFSFFALVVWNKKDGALHFGESGVHMTLTPFQTGGWAEQGCLLEHRSTRQMPRSDRDTTNLSVCVCARARASPPVLSVGPFSPSDWWRFPPLAPGDVAAQKGHSGWNKDPLIVPLSERLGQSAGGCRVPRAPRSQAL